MIHAVLVQADHRTIIMNHFTPCCSQCCVDIYVVECLVAGLYVIIIAVMAMMLTCCTKLTISSKLLIFLLNSTMVSICKETSVYVATIVY